MVIKTILVVWPVDVRIIVCYVWSPFIGNIRWKSTWVRLGIVFIRVKVTSILGLISSFGLLLVEIFLVDVRQIRVNFWHLMNGFIFVFLFVDLKGLLKITEYCFRGVRFVNIFISARFLGFSVLLNDSIELKIFLILEERWDHVGCLVAVRVDVLYEFTVGF